ncbi:MAG: DUF4956 domain-containing protein [Eubacteriales bacterium]|nr:DUF4956 domain-containing protein [Eubacteriales bacterium]
MSIRDAFKQSFISNFAAADIGVLDIAVVLFITLLLSLYLFFIYRFLTRKTFYNKNFNISLSAMALITAAIIVTIQSSIVVSLGMVGALSIVRFRTAVKDPLDLVFLFWAISIGIICGAGLYLVAAALSVTVTLVLWFLNALPVAKAPLLLLVQADSAARESALLAAITPYSRYFHVKSRSVRRDALDIVIEVRARQEAELLQAVCALDGVRSASLLAHDGEVTF